MGLFDDMIPGFSLQGLIEASKNENGKPDPWKAAGIAAGMGLNSAQLAELGALLGAQGAFDSEKGDISYTVFDDADDEDDDDETSTFLRELADPELRSQAKELLDAGLDLFDLEIQDGEDLWESVKDLGLDPADFRLEDLAAEAGNYTSVPNWNISEDERLHQINDEDLLEQARTLISAGLDLNDLILSDGPEIFVKVYRLGLDPDSFDLEGIAAELGNFIDIPD